MIDQSHNVTDPIESLLLSAERHRRQLRAALIVDREALAEHQNANDVVMAFSDLRRAYETDVAPILAMARYELGGAIDPVDDLPRLANGAPRKAQERGRAPRSAGIV